MGEPSGRQGPGECGEDSRQLALSVWTGSHSIREVKKEKNDEKWDPMEEI